MPDVTEQEALAVAIEALDFAEQRARDYDGYPSYEFRQQQLARIQEAKAVLRKMRSPRS
jgi:hypothetical protein